MQISFLIVNWIHFPRMHVIGLKTQYFLLIRFLSSNRTVWSRKVLIRAVFKWLSKNQNQSNYFDQSQPEQAARWKNQFLAILCNLLQVREKSRVHGAIGFGFASHWLKNCASSKGSWQAYTTPTVRGICTFAVFFSVSRPFCSFTLV